MHASKTSILLAGIAIVSIPATIAIAKVTNDIAPLEKTPRQIMLDGYQGDGRPMDDIGSNIPYGDLSAFDKITTIGAAQSPDVPYCDQRATLLETLDHDFAESPRVKKAVGKNRSVELWASSVMGTWTAVYTRADGVSCVVSSGMGWEQGDNPVALLHREGILPAA
ncbi:hypothetical protein [Thioclava pacifica]|uniref:Uncharacterized protein n=1 Tax=Thioclava pacifica DSM 10166 TaxID=1353537 RepID=A0A074J9M8_9RHOB|nr:hypothetical protein [Thioclava pacifica]KEO54311.1 hypothetical protein TP2_05130 [Thioclava pacifica DSM 10166]